MKKLTKIYDIQHRIKISFEKDKIERSSLSSKRILIEQNK